MGPETPDTSMTPYTTGTAGNQEMYEDDKATWLKVWEDRLKLRERSLETAGTPFVKSRACPVLGIRCNECKAELSTQAMRVYYKSDSHIEAFSTDQHPNGITESSSDVNHNLCNCKIREINCCCGTMVGYKMRKRCRNCTSASEEDEGHKWLFNSQSVFAQPKLHRGTGEALLWPGCETVNGPESSPGEASPGVEGFFDENSLVQPDAASPWNCSPLMDRNGRPRTSLDKINQNKVDLGLKDTDLQALEEVEKVRAEQFETGLKQRAQEKYLQDASLEQERIDKELQQRKIVLDAKERELKEQAHQLSTGADEVARLSLLRAEQKASQCEAKAEALHYQLAEQNRIAMAAEEKVSSKSQEIEQLHSALADARREARKGSFAVGAGRLPPHEEASGAAARRVQELEQELTCERLELQRVRAELQQAKQRSDGRESSHIEKLLLRQPPPPMPPASRTAGSKRLSGTDVENERLHRELESTRAEALQLRSENERLRAHMMKAGSDEFSEARVAVAQRLTKKREELDRREQALAAREANAFPSRSADGGHYGGGSGLPPQPGIFERLSCARRHFAGGYLGFMR